MPLALHLHINPLKGGIPGPGERSQGHARRLAASDRSGAQQAPAPSGIGVGCGDGPKAGLRRFSTPDDLGSFKVHGVKGAGIDD